jgi:hypothetical protein
MDVGVTGNVVFFYLNAISQSLAISWTLWYGKGKGKAVPLQAWSGLEGSRKLRFSDFLTTAQYSGKVVSLTHRTHLSPGTLTEFFPCFFLSCEANARVKLAKTGHCLISCYLCCSMYFIFADCFVLCTVCV